MSAARRARRGRVLITHDQGAAAAETRRGNGVVDVPCSCSSDMITPRRASHSYGSWPGPESPRPSLRSPHHPLAVGRPSTGCASPWPAGDPRRGGRRRDYPDERSPVSAAPRLPRRTIPASVAPRLPRRTVGGAAVTPTNESPARRGHESPRPASTTSARAAARWGRKLTASSSATGSGRQTQRRPISPPPSGTPENSQLSACAM